MALFGEKRITIQDIWSNSETCPSPAKQKYDCYELGRNNYK